MISVLFVIKRRAGDCRAVSPNKRFRRVVTWHTKISIKSTERAPVCICVREASYWSQPKALFSPALAVYTPSCAIVMESDSFLMRPLWAAKARGFKCLRQIRLVGVQHQSEIGADYLIAPLFARVSPPPDTRYVKRLARLFRMSHNLRRPLELR